MRVVSLTCSQWEIFWGKLNFHFLKKDFIYSSRDGKGGRETPVRERHCQSLPLARRPVQARRPGVEPGPFALSDGTPPTEPRQSGLNLHVKDVLILSNCRI